MFEEHKKHDVMIATYTIFDHYCHMVFIYLYGSFVVLVEVVLLKK